MRAWAGGGTALAPRVCCRTRVPHHTSRSPHPRCSPASYPPAPGIRPATRGDEHPAWVGWARQCEVRTSSMRSAWLPGELIEGRNAPSPALASLKARGRPPLSMPHPAWSGQCLPAAVPTTGHNAHRRPRATAGAEPRADALRAANNAVRNISRYAITYRNGHDPILSTTPTERAPQPRRRTPTLFGRLGDHSPSHTWIGPAMDCPAAGLQAPPRSCPLR